MTSQSTTDLCCPNTHRGGNVRGTGILISGIYTIHTIAPMCIYLIYDHFEWYNGGVTPCRNLPNEKPVLWIVNTTGLINSSTGHIDSGQKGNRL